VKGSDSGLIRNYTPTLAIGIVENTKIIYQAEPKFERGEFRKRSSIATQWIEMSVRKVCGLKYKWHLIVTLVHPG